MEFWKDIPDLEGYQASTQGRIKSLAKSYKTGKGYIRYVPDRIMTCRKLTSKGYMRVRIKKTTYQIHRLIAITFLGAPLPNSDRNQVNHIDGDKTNNSIENLEWTTNQENRNHAYKLGLIAYDTRTSNTKYPKQLILDIRELYSKGLSQAKIARMLKLDYRYVQAVVRNKIRNRFCD